MSTPATDQAVIVIPDMLWAKLVDELRRPHHRNLERVGFIDGVVGRDIAVATTIVIPDAELHRGYYDVSAAAMSQAGQHFRRYRLQRLAQVHTHERRWVGHSERDDAMAYSQEVGSISIVLPEHARHRPAIADAGVHLREQHGWRQLDRAEVAERIRIVPSFLDFR